MLKTYALAMTTLFLSSAPQLSFSADSDVVMQCHALQSADFSGIQDAPTKLSKVTLIEATADRPAHCHAIGYVSPQIGIELHLPLSNWNGKFLKLGCGGFCGQTGGAVNSCGEMLRKGYACITSDMGHQGSGAEWAYNNIQAEVDYGYRATHVAALAGKAIAESFYGRAPAKSYFVGCSTGGRQGLVSAQRFPWDFDGIVAGAPAINLPATLLNIMWASLAVEGKDGQPLFTSADLEVLQRGALAKCDMDDGVKDRIIGNPRACAFDPAELVCKSSGGRDCLSQEQADAARKIYAGPTSSDGKRIYGWEGAMPGAEMEFLGYQNRSPFGRDFFRYLGFMPDPGPSWDRRDFDFDRDYKRLGMMEALYYSSNPDLRQFKQSGGKLILYHGWSDAGGGGIPPGKTVDYYETVEKTMGGRKATQEFLRFFAIPVMGHCGGGTGANVFDYLSYLEAWVERGEAPEVMIGAHVDISKFYEAHATDKDYSGLANFVQDPANRKFTRPVFLYPTTAKYKGKGNPNDAKNFVPVSGHQR